MSSRYNSTTMSFPKLEVYVTELNTKNRKKHFVFPERLLNRIENIIKSDSQKTDQS